MLTLVRDLNERQKLWRSSKPITYFGEISQYVVTSIGRFTLETYAFLADADGKVLVWNELPGSLNDTDDHELVVAGVNNAYPE